MKHLAAIGFGYTARALEDAEMADMARSFYSENKRVSNKRMKSELGYQPMYPTYREGLQAIWKESFE